MKSLLSFSSHLSARSCRRLWCLGLALGATAVVARSQVGTSALLNHPPAIDGHVTGSVQWLAGEDVTFGGIAAINGDLLVPGTPQLVTNGHGTFAGTRSGTGSIEPSQYSIVFNGNASAGYILTRTPGSPVPSVSPPPAAMGTRNVILTSSTASFGDPTTLRDLTISGTTGAVSLPAGTYGRVAVNAGNTLVLGGTGAGPAIYNLQSLNLSGNSSVRLVGTVIINLAESASINGMLGSADHPAWLAINFASGGLTADGNSAVYGYVLAPSGTVALNGASSMTGGVAADRLTVAGRASLTIVPDHPPQVALTQPSPGAVFAAPATILLSASASDPDGSVARVEFFQGTTKLGETSLPPYQFTWGNVPSGTYFVTAVATDNLGAKTTSAPISVISDIPPAVQMTSPADGARLIRPAPTPVSANASDADGTVVKVEFFDGDVKIGEATAAPFSVTWDAPAAGSHTVTARATDDRGLSTTSDPSKIWVNSPPSVTLTSPTAGATFDSSAPIPLAADASDTDGTVTRVEFFAGTTKLGEATSAPWQFTWTAAAAGTYTVTAVATDNDGASTTSAGISITVKDSVSATDLQLTPWQGTDDYKRDRILTVRAAIANVNPPISFYGRVVDQNNTPVAGAVVTLSIRSTQEVLPGDAEDGFTSVTETTDTNGAFQLTGAHGSLLTISSVAKDGYEANGVSSRSYWYWDEFSPTPFTPDPANPEVIKIWKQAGAQPLVVVSKLMRIPYDGTVTTIDLVTGDMVTAGGDLQVSLTRPMQVDGLVSYDWSVTVGAVGGGVIASTDSQMNLAPDSGYQSQVTIQRPAADPQWSPVGTFSFYVMSRNGQNYARVTLLINSGSSQPTTSILLNSYLNPAASRILEYDSDQAIRP